MSSIAFRAACGRAAGGNGEPQPEADLGVPTLAGKVDVQQDFQQSDDAPVGRRAVAERLVGALALARPPQGVAARWHGTRVRRLAKRSRPPAVTVVTSSRPTARVPRGLWPPLAAVLPPDSICSRPAPRAFTVEPKLAGGSSPSRVAATAPKNRLRCGSGAGRRSEAVRRGPTIVPSTRPAAGISRRTAPLPPKAAG